MGSLYARKDDPALSKQALARVILSPEALNRAHGPDGFLRTFDLRPELGAITAPTLILAGRHDWISAPEFAQEIHQLIAGSDLRIFEESSHSLSGDEPQCFADAIAGFLVYNTREVRGRSPR
jgi:proline iminopeptidase